MASDVGGGMISTMNRFFPDNGFYQLCKKGEFWPRESDFPKSERADYPGYKEATINVALKTR